MIELETYFIKCPHCTDDVEFAVNQVDGLPRDIEEECSAAARIAEQEIEGQYAGMVDPDDLPIQPRMIHDLSQAIACSNLTEARILLDRIAYELGLEHSEACEIGRFAKVVA